MTSINPNQINSMAQEIAKLLDAKEETAETRGNDTIEASIWNKFVGQGQPQEQQVGNGDKSTIKNHISMSDAVNSIASYIKNKGTTAISNALKQLGIDWKPSEEVQANSTTDKSANTNTTNKTDSNDLEQIRERIRAKGGNVSEKMKAFAEKEKAKQAKFKELEKQKNTIKASNGKTYNQIKNELYTILNHSLLMVKDSKTGKPRKPTCSEYHDILRRDANNQNISSAERSHYKKCLDELENLLKGKKELEQKYPEFKSVRYTVMKCADGSEAYMDDSMTIEQTGLLDE